MTAEENRGEGKITGEDKKKRLRSEEIDLPYEGKMR